MKKVIINDKMQTGNYYLSEEMDQTCRKKQRQALLHWAYDSRKL